LQRVTGDTSPGLRTRGRNLSDLHPVDWLTHFRHSAPEYLRRSHRIVSSSRPEVRRLLGKLLETNAELTLFPVSGLSGGTARLRNLGENSLVFSLDPTVTAHAFPQDMFVASKTYQRPCFFAVKLEKIRDSHTCETLFPTVIYEYERRDHTRESLGAIENQPAVVTSQTGLSTQAWVRDRSRCGIGLLVPEAARIVRGETVGISIRGAGNNLTEVRGEIRQLFPFRLMNGWNKIGIVILPRKRDHSLRIEMRDLEISGGDVAKSPATSRSSRPEIMRQIVTSRVNYVRRDGEPIVGILDRVGTKNLDIAVVIPPAWGKIKETNLWLSQTIIESFACANVNAAVIRYDGTRWRGESFKNSRRFRDGNEDVTYTFSQGSQDITATIDFFTHASELRPPKIILVTVSSTAIEARHAIAQEVNCRVAGWISIVGAPDVQSLIRSVTGGIDYLGDSLVGMRFGIQEIQGVRLDVDNAAQDAIANKIGFIEDARREIADIRIPITWFSGTHDAWIDVERVRDILTIGDSANRRLIKLPIGHQLDSGQGAAEVARMVTLEIARMTGIRGVVAVRPNREKLTRRRREELQEVHRRAGSFQGFWRQYLLGRSGSVGMELIAGTEVYREFLRSCLQRMHVGSMRKILDLGSGLGTFSRELAISRLIHQDITVVQLDFVKEALMESRKKIGSSLSSDSKSRIRLLSVLADLELDGWTRCCPFSASSFDCVMIVLVLNYIKNYEKLLRQVNGLLKPGGQFILACLRRDADTSKICWSGISELQSGLAEREIGDRAKALDRSLAEYISHAARLFELEQMGEFIFWDREELVSLVERAGFEVSAVWSAFGDPPQAYVVSANKPG
jgi:SAM-dependent methyltransferase